MNLGDGILAWQPLEEIRSKFETAYDEAGKPVNMALFKRQDSEGRLHCQVILYFPPCVESFARSLGAMPCRRPAPEGLEWLAGVEAWRHLFDDRA